MRSTASHSQADGSPVDPTASSRGSFNSPFPFYFEKHQTYKTVERAVERMSVAFSPGVRRDDFLPLLLSSV